MTGRHQPQIISAFFAPTSTSEVGVTQRHSGAWDATKSRIEGTAGANSDGAIVTNEEYTRIEGLQIQITNSDGYNPTFGIGVGVIAASSDIRIANNIIKGVISGAGSIGQGINENVYGSASIYNNIVYDFVNGTENCVGLTLNIVSGAAYVYNNTFSDNFFWN